MTGSSSRIRASSSGAQRSGLIIAAKRKTAAPAVVFFCASMSSRELARGLFHRAEGPFRRPRADSVAAPRRRRCTPYASIFLERMKAWQPCSHRLEQATIAAGNLGRQRHLVRARPQLPNFQLSLVPLSQSGHLDRQRADVADDCGHAECADDQCACHGYRLGCCGPGDRGVRGASSKTPSSMASNRR